MSVHTNPRQCLKNLIQQQTDGGRTEYLQQEWRSTETKPAMPTADCAVVALVHAAFRPTTGQSYREALFDLSMSIRPWMYEVRQEGERQLHFFYRRFRQWLRPPKPDPIHGTPTHATSSWITTMLRYELIYPNEQHNWYCICDMMCTYVLDVLIPNGHTMTIHQRVAYTTTRFDPVETEVGNVHRLSAQRTKELKAQRQYEKDERLWFARWTEGGALRLPNWDSRPNPENYLKSKIRRYETSSVGRLDTQEPSPESGLLTPYTKDFSSEVN